MLLHEPDGLSAASRDVGLLHGPNGLWAASQAVVGCLTAIPSLYSVPTCTGSLYGCLEVLGLKHMCAAHTMMVSVAGPRLYRHGIVLWNDRGALPQVPLMANLKWMHGAEWTKDNASGR